MRFTAGVLELKNRHFVIEADFGLDLAFASDENLVASQDLRAGLQFAQSEKGALLAFDEDRALVDGALDLLTRAPTVLGLQERVQPRARVA